MGSNILQRDTSFEGVLEYIRGAILNGEFPPGMQLKQSLIATELGVSQGPTREALVHLVGEGLVESIPYRGMFVRKITEKDVEEIYQLRTVLESLAIELSSPNLDKGHYDELEEIINKIFDAVQKGDHDTAVLEDLNFHRYLVELSDNSRLIKFWDSLLTQSRFALRNLYASPERSLKDVLVMNHKKILEAIQNGKGVEIKETIKEHMDFARSRLLLLVREDSTIK